jgi:hypothetical protein
MSRHHPHVTDQVAPRGRRKPYSERGISRVPCVKCGKPSKYQWQVCVDGSWRGVCEKHDRELNRIGLVWAFGRKKADEMMRGYDGT